MNPFMYREYLNYEYLQKVISLGDMFGVQIRNVDTETDCIYFTNGTQCQGFLDGRYNNKYFELNSPFGKIKGYFSSNLSMSFSLAVRGKPYDTISGIYDASFGWDAYIPDDDGFRRHFNSIPSVTCSLRTMINQKTLQTILLNGGDFQLTQCYPGSPAPHERLFVEMRSQRRSSSKFSLLHTKSIDVSHRSPLTQTLIAQRGNRIHMFEPTELKVECFEEKDSFGNAKMDLREVYHILSQYDDGIKSCLDYFHESLTFGGLDLYQNIVSACFPSLSPGVVSLVTGVQKSAYQKNLGLVSRLNAQRR